MGDRSGSGNETDLCEKDAMAPARSTAILLAQPREPSAVHAVAMLSVALTNWIPCRLDRLISLDKLNMRAHPELTPGGLEDGRPLHIKSQC